MEYGVINYWAVLVAGIVYMVIGALWYSPVLFGNAWMKGIGKTKEQIESDFSPVNYVVALIFSLIAAYGIARVMVWANGDSIGDGIIVALLAGICFVLPTMGVNDSFETRPRGLTFMNIFYHLVGFTAMGVIIGAW